MKQITFLLFALLAIRSQAQPAASPKNNLPSINLDKYINMPEDVAIKEIDGLYPNTSFTAIENVSNILYNRRFNLVYHLIDKYNVKPTVDYLYDLNKYDFVCGVGLKRTKDVSPTCKQPKVFQDNQDSDAKVKLAGLILSKGIRADFLSAQRCVRKNEFPLFKLLYESLIKGQTSNVDGEKLLVDAVDAGCYDMVKYLLDNNISAKCHDHSGGKDIQDAFYAIYRAVPFPEIFFLLVEHGADITVQGYSGTTPIVHAAREGCTEVLQYLLDKGIDPYEIHGNMSAYDMAKKYNLKNSKEATSLFKKYKKK